MKSLILAIFELIAWFLKEEKQQIALPKITSNVPVGMKPYKFFCWLCSGESTFACKPKDEEKKYRIECQWCGVENSVKVKPKITLQNP